MQLWRKISIICTEIDVLIKNQIIKKEHSNLSLNANLNPILNPTLNHKSTNPTITAPKMNQPSDRNT
jgi:hypothetical protein